MSALIEDIELICPYCGETMEVDVDCTAGNQVYYEDCQVCCQPILLEIRPGNGQPLVEARREND